jgi:3-oxoacyl-[acyl-carrier-protein] synthase III
MNNCRWATVEAIRSYLPERVVTNAELAPELGWSPEEILAKTGISQRHVAGANECVSDMSVLSAEKLFRECAIDRKAVEFLIQCTQTPDHYLPATACLVQHRLGLSDRCAAFDINQGCSGYIYSLGLASALIRSGMAQCGLVLTGDNYTKFINAKDRSVRTLFGDASTATLIRASEEPGLDAFVFGTDGAGAKNLIIPAGGTRLPRSEKTAQPVTDSSGNTRCPNDLFMDGPQIFSFTLKRVPELLSSVLARSSLQATDIDWFVLHQANRYMLDHLRQKLKVPQERLVWFLENVGNTVSSTIPLALEHAAAKGQFGVGQRLFLAGFGVGYSWGATLLRWTEPTK